MLNFSATSADRLWNLSGSFPSCRMSFFHAVLFCRGEQSIPRSCRITCNRGGQRVRTGMAGRDGANERTSSSASAPNPGWQCSRSLCSAGRSPREAPRPRYPAITSSLSAARPLPGGWPQRLLIAPPRMYAAFKCARRNAHVHCAIPAPAASSARREAPVGGGGTPKTTGSG